MNSRLCSSISYIAQLALFSLLFSCSKKLDVVFSESFLAFVDQSTVLGSIGVEVSDNGPIVAGSSISVTVVAYNGNGDLFSSFSGEVSFSSTDTNSSTVLPSNYTFSSSDVGRKTFTGVILTTAGNQTISATSTSDSSISGTSQAVTVTGLNKHTKFVVEMDSSVSNSVLVDVTVKAGDVYGNPVDNYLGTIQFSTGDSDGSVVLPSNYTFVSADVGVKVFTSGLKLITLTSSQYVRVEDTSDSSLNGEKSDIEVAIGPVSTFQISGMDDPIIVGAVDSNVVVGAYDAGGHLVTSYNGTVTFSSSDGSATLPSDTPLISGTQTFSIAFGTAGTHSLAV